MIKFKELKQITKAELEKKIKDDREKLRQLRFDLAGGKVKNVREIRHIKKEIAQVMTLLNPKHEAQSTKQIKNSNV